MPQAAATKLIFQSLLSWALPPLLSSELSTTLFCAAPQPGYKQAAI